MSASSSWFKKERLGPRQIKCGKLKKEKEKSLRGKGGTQKGLVMVKTQIIQCCVPRHQENIAIVLVVELIQQNEFFKVAL